MPYLVIFQGKTEQFDDRTHSDTLVMHLRAAGIKHRYTQTPGKAQPKKHTCKECGDLHYTYQQSMECCR